MPAPGVYIEENSSLALSVRSGATAVPVFVGNFKERADFVGPKNTSDRCIAIANWLDFTARFEGPTRAEMNVTLTTEVTDAWKKEQTKEWAEKLASEVTAAGGETSIKSQLKAELRSLLETLEDKKWVVKATTDLKTYINDLTLLTTWATAVDKKFTQADAINFPEEGAAGWIDKWINKTLQLAWQEFNTDQADNQALKTEEEALAVQAVDAIPNEVTERLDVNAVTIVTGKPAFIVDKKVHLPDETAYSATVNLNYGAFALQHYFSNGGTGCYLFPLAEDRHLLTLPEEIQKYPDISLLVCPEPVVEGGMTSKKKQAVYTALNGLLGKQEGYFLLADGQEGPGTIAAQTAVYYPNLVTTLQPSMPAVGDISFTDEAAKPIQLTLAKMTGPDFDTLREIVMAKVEEALKKIIKTTPQIILPPSAAVAGAYARTDLERGVWKAPANVPLNAVERVETVITDADQGLMNDKGINVIRTFTGQGTIIWGARTLDATSDLWRYIPVRRLYNAAERDIKKAMSVAMFEPNSAPTWESVRSAIDHYLYRLWQQGALMGISQKEAYFVQIGKGITMTEDDIEQGRMIVKVGMAAVRPAEFIILQFTQDMA